MLAPGKDSVHNMAENAIKRFFSELKRRKVYSAAVAYLVVGWILIEAGSILVPTLLLPDWTMRLLTVLIILGFPLAIVLAWIFDVSPRGLERTADYMQQSSDVSSAPLSEVVERALVPPDADAAIASVAVLPFDALGGGEEEKILSEGLATEIRNELSKLHRIRVASRHSAVRYRDQNVSPEEIASALNIRYVLSGNLICLGERVRIIAELDDASEGVQVWSRRYERDMQDVLSVLREISESVVGAFGVERLKKEIRRAHHGEPEILAAWNLVQKARGCLLESSESSFKTAHDKLQRAIALDPNYAAAHATLGTALSERLLNGFGSDSEAEIALIKSVTERALALAPQDPFVLKMSGLAWSAIGEPTRAIGALKSAVAMSPYDFGAWGYMGWPLTARGKATDIEELFNILNRALIVAPDHPGIAFWLHHCSVAYACTGDPEKSAEFASQAIQKHPALSWGWLNYANALGLLNKSEEAKRAAQSALEANPNMTVKYFVRQIKRMSEGAGFFKERTQGLTSAGLTD